MHPIDRLGAVLIKRGPRRLRIFPDGWGDKHYVAQLADTSSLATPPPSIDIAWGRTQHLADRTIRDGHFEALTDVPPEARRATIRIIEPPHGAPRLCLLMAAWNDHGYNTRELLAGELLKRGMASLILEIPYYGSRRLVDPDEQPIRTVADFSRMGLGAVTEGRALLSHFRDEYIVGVSGYSMGGNIGALVGATAGFPVAMAPLAASHSPGPVFLDGVISRGIQWDGLGGMSQSNALRRALSAASVLKVPTPEWSKYAVIVAARHDGFIPNRAVTALHHHWTGSELRWRPGGHATLLWRQRSALAEAIADSFEKLEASDA